MRKQWTMVMVLLLVLSGGLYAADATLENLKDAMSELVGDVPESYEFFNYTGEYGYRTKYWCTMGDCGDSSRESWPDNGEVEQVLEGLSASTRYDIWILAAGKDTGGSSEDWGIRFGLESGNYSMICSNIPRDTAITEKYDLGDYVDDVAGTNPFREDSNTAMWAVYCGSAVADETGTITVYVNDVDEIEYNGFPGDRTWYDGIVLKANFAAYDPSPEDGAIKVSVEEDTVLSWTMGVSPDILGFNVYLGEAEDSMAVLNGSVLDTSVTEFNIGTLPRDKTYFWQVEEVLSDGLGGQLENGDPNNAFSDVWSFSTEVSTPVVVAGPEDVLASVGDTVQFAITVESLTTPSYTWYRSLDDATDTVGDDTELSTDDVLTVEGVGVNQEGYYYCVVTNASDVDIFSPTATLAIKRTVAHWTLNSDNLVDSSFVDVSGNGNDTTDPNNPTFIDGVVDGDQDATNAVAEGAVEIGEFSGWCSAGSFNPSALSGEFTASAWVYHTQAANLMYSMIVAKRTSWTEGGSYWTFLITDRGQLRFQSYGASTLNSELYVIQPNTWHHVAVTFADDHAVMYIDGYVAGESEFFLADNPEAAFWIGRNESIAERFDGALDDIQMYNYALSQEEIVDLYYGETGETVCVEPIEGSDLNGDCKVNLEDLALFAADWMKDGWYPVL